MSEQPEQPVPPPQAAPPVVAPDWSVLPPPSQPAPTPQVNGAFGTIVPTRNPMALFAYYAAVFGVIPCACAVLGPLAIFLGAKGLKAIQATPDLPGKGHAYFGIIVGVIETVAAIAMAFWIAGISQG